MPLNHRQEQLYTFLADLFAPLDPDLTSGQAGADLQYPGVPTFANVACYHQETDEFGQSSPIGRTRLDNIFTTDKFKFCADQQIADMWMIRLWNPQTIADTDSLASQFFIVQGGTQDKPNQGIRSPNFRQIYAIKTSRPRTIDGGGILIVRSLEVCP